MTNEEIKALDIEALETRTSEIKALIEENDKDTDFEALSLELDAIKERKAEIAEETRKADIMAVINETDRRRDTWQTLRKSEQVRNM